MRSARLAYVLVAVAAVLSACTGSTSPSPSSPSAPESMPAGEQQIQLTVDGETRHALIERPTSGAHRRPLIIFLHGAGNSARLVRDQLQIVEPARRAGVLVVFPDGDSVRHSWRAGCCGPYAVSSHDFDLLRALIHRLVASGEVDPTHIALGGFSAGGILANSFACSDPGLVRGVLAVAGGLLEPPSFVQPSAAGARACTPSQPVTVLQVHGRIDHTVPIAGNASRCRTQPCIPGTPTYLASADTIDRWWRRLDGCGNPVERQTSPTVVVRLSTCRAGTVVGLALVRFVAHDLPNLAAHFDVRGTLIALATGAALTAW